MITDVVPVVVPPDVPDVPVVVVCANTEVAIAVNAKVASNRFIIRSSLAKMMAMFYLNGFLGELTSVKTKVDISYLFYIYKYLMKHILLFLALSIATLVNAEEFTLKKEVQCDKTDVMLAILKSEKFEEVPIWLGKGESKAPNYSLFVNSETRTWTIIQFSKEYSCVLGSGESYNVISKKPYT